MEYLIISIVSIVILIILAYIVELNFKKVKKIAENEELNKITDRFPENKEIAKNILEKLNNKKVIIEENNNGKASLYIVTTNKILIANIRSNFTRVQTIAHECIHSTQNKRLLWSNFIFSNIYIIYTILLIILTIFKILKPNMVYVAILLLLGMLHYFIRGTLELDAMIRARYLAKEYLEDNSICTKETINKIITEYDKINNIGIKMVNYNIFAGNIIKVIIYCIICAI